MIHTYDHIQANFDELLARTIAYNDAKDIGNTSGAAAGATATETAGSSGGGGSGGCDGGREEDSAIVPKKTGGQDDEGEEDGEWDVSLEAVVFYLFTNNPASQNPDTVASLTDGRDEDDGDQELQQALSLSLQQEAS